MDNKKIGKLIADLRKKNGLTQQELGDKVGVGFRAVSKWERGITLPDISIINELSDILGISSNELLAGKVTKEIKTKPKISKKLKIILSISISIITIFLLTFIYNNNRTYTYNIDSLSDEYYVEGQVIIHKKNIQIIINELNFTTKDFLKTKIKNYDYQIFSAKRLLYGYGNTEVNTKFEKIKTIKEFTEIFKINYNGGTTIKPQDIVKNGLKINLIFETENNGNITKIIETKLTSKEHKMA